MLQCTGCHVALVYLIWYTFIIHYSIHLFERLFKIKYLRLNAIEIANKETDRRSQTPGRQMKLSIFTAYRRVPTL